MCVRKRETEEEKEMDICNWCSYTCAQLMHFAINLCMIHVLHIIMWLLQHNKVWELDSYKHILNQLSWSVFNFQLVITSCLCFIHFGNCLKWLKFRSVFLPNLTSLQYYLLHDQKIKPFWVLSPIQAQWRVDANFSQYILWPAFNSNEWKLINCYLISTPLWELRNLLKE